MQILLTVEWQDRFPWLHMLRPCSPAWLAYRNETASKKNHTSLGPVRSGGQPNFVFSKSTFLAENITKVIVTWWMLKPSATKWRNWHWNFLSFIRTWGGCFSTTRPLTQKRKNVRFQHSFKKKETKHEISKKSYRNARKCLAPATTNYKPSETPERHFSLIFSYLYFFNAAGGVATTNA